MDKQLGGVPRTQKQKLIKVEGLNKVEDLIKDTSAMKIQRAQKAAKQYAADSAPKKFLPNFKPKTSEAERPCSKPINKSPKRLLVYSGDSDIEKEKALKEKEKVLQKKVETRRKHKFFLLHEFVPQSGHPQPPLLQNANQEASGPNHFSSLLVGDMAPQVGFGLPSFASPVIGLDDSTKNLLNNFTISMDRAIDTLKSHSVTHEVGGSSKELMSEFNDTVFKAVNTLKNPAISIDVGEGVNMFDKLSTAVSDFAIIMLICAILCIYKPKTQMEKACLSMLIIGYLVSRGTLKSLWEESGMATWFSKPVCVHIDEAYSPQSGFVPALDDTATLISGLLSSYICMQSGQKLFDARELARVVGVCGKMKIGIKSITDAILIMTNFVHSSIDTWFNGRSFFIRSGHEFIDTFLLEGKEILNLAESKELQNLQSSLDRVNSAIALGESVTIKIPGSSDLVGLRMHTINVLAELRKVKKNLIASNFKFAGIRVEPVALMLRGPPGVGKSQAMQHIAHAINALTLSPRDFELYRENPGSATYNRQAENVYWDGYEQAKQVVFFDDLLQARDIQGNPDNEAMNVIRAVNVFENQLHVAGMEGKGNTTFRSKFVIANTNMRNFSFESINQPGAFLRRWDIVVDVIPKDEYCIDPTVADWDKRFDPDKLTKFGPDDVDGTNPKFAHLIGTTRIHPTMCVYRKQRLDVDVNNPKFVDAGFTLEFDDLVQMFYQYHVKKGKFYDMYLKELDETLVGYRLKSEFNPEPPFSTVFTKFSGTFSPQVGVSNTNTPTRQEILDNLSSLLRSFNLSDEKEWKLDYIRIRCLSEYTFVVCMLDTAIKHATTFNHTLDQNRMLDVLVDYVEHNTMNEIMDKSMTEVVESIFTTYGSYSFRPQVGSMLDPLQMEEVEEPKPGLFNLSLQSEVKLGSVRYTDYDKYTFMITLLHASIRRVEASGSQAGHDELLEIIIKQLDHVDTTLSEYISPEQFENTVDLVVGEYLNPKTTPFYLKKWPIIRSQFEKHLTTLHEYGDQESPEWLKKVYAAYKCAYSYMLYTFDTGMQLGLAGINKLPGGTLGMKLMNFSGGVAAIAAGISLITFFVRSTGLEDDSEPESDERSNRVRHTRIVKPRTKVQTPSGVVFKPESLVRVNENLSAIIKKIILTNTFEVWLPQREEGKEQVSYLKMGYALGIRGRSVIMPYHFVSVISSELEQGLLKPTDLICMYRPATKYKEFIIPCEEFLECFQHMDRAERQDVAMVRFPKRFNPVSDITKYFATEKQMSKYTKIDGVLVVPSTGGKGSENWRISEFHSIVAQQGQNAPVESKEFDKFTVAELFMYSAHTTSGDCGSPFFVNDKSLAPCVLGIHVAGSTATRIGFSAKVSRELLEEYLKLMEEDYEQVDNYNLDLIPTEDQPDNMVNLGKYGPQVLHPSTGGKTKIVRSPLWGKIDEVKKAPARLTPFEKDGETIDPMAMAIAKYSQEETYIPTLSVNAAVTSLMDMMESESVHKVKREIYDFEHAVCGDEEGDFQAVPRGTSAGYPYNIMSGDSTKARFFGHDELYDLENEEALKLKVEVDLTIDLAREGKRLTHYFTDHLKDERRSKKKVEAGETRLISGCPMTLLVCFRMWFGDFMKWVIRNRIRNGMLIGINEYSSEWNTLAIKLEKFGVGMDNVGAGDYKGFDMRHNNAVAWAILRAINDWYNDGLENQRIRATLWEEITNSLHLGTHSVFQWKHPLPSGCPPTTVFNCMANAIYFRLCWIDIIHPNERYAHDFNRHVYLCVLGDDNAFSVSSEYKELFTEKSIGESMKKLGQIYTPEDKEKAEHSSALRNLTDITLLKRRFFKHPKTATYLAPLDLDTVLDIPNWSKRGVDYIAIAQDNCKIFLEELSLHPRMIFDHWRAVLLKAIDEVEDISRPDTTDYDALFRQVLVRERFSDAEQRFLTDYDRLVYNIPGEQDYAERFKEQRAGLLKLTSKVAHWQPQSNLGNRGHSQRLVHPVGTISTATTSEPLGLSNEGTMETERAAQISSQNIGTTHSTVDAETPVTKMTSYVPLSKDVLDNAVTLQLQDITTFLAKPVIVSSGVLSTTDSSSSWKWQSGIPGALLYSQNMWVRKLEGHFAFRGTLHLTVQVNATRFQQGRYILAWIPSGGAVNEDKWARNHAASLCQLTQLPHVEIDINCDSEATLIIPHVTAQAWAIFDPLTPASYGNNGRVIFVPYSPLQLSTGSTTANYSILAHWEDVELAMPVNPQSGRTRTRIKRRVGAAAAEQESAGVGPISGSLSRLSTSASIMAGVPLLASVASNVAWAADLASKSAKSFGWSKPHNSEHSQIMTKHIMPKYSNVDTVDGSTKMGFFDNNEIEDLPGFAGSNLDEMSLSYIASISAYFRTVNWTTGSATGSTLDTYDMFPKEYYTTTVQNGVTLNHLTPMTFVSSFFALWRGSLKFTFKIMKTEFHTGRLMLSFFPRENMAGLTYPHGTTATSSFVHREIIDVRDGNEFTFIVPYMSVTPYRGTSGLDASYGRMILTVLNPLVAPANVSSSIPIVVEVCAGPDFEWAQPADATMLAVQNFSPQVGRNDCEITEGVIGGGKLHMNANSSRLCIGERVLSFRSLAKRMNFITNLIDDTPSAFLNYNPFQADIGFIDTAVTYKAPLYYTDIYTHMCNIFALFRGGIRVKAFNIEDNNLSYSSPIAFSSPYKAEITFSAPNFGFFPTASGPITYLLTPARCNAVFRTDASGGVEVEHPFYNKTHSAACGDMLATATTNTNGTKYNPLGPVPRTYGYIWYKTTPPAAPLVMRSISEDASFGLFVSIPPYTNWDSARIN